MARKVSSKVTQVADEQVRDYELVMVISPALAEEEVDAAVGKVSQFITERNGTVATVEQWGKRKLAYPVGHFVEGNYVLAQFSISPRLTRELEASMHISEGILRYLLTRAKG